MSKIWTAKRLKLATIGKRIATYEAIAATPEEEKIKMQQPKIFKFPAISIGDAHGQAFLVPLDESSRETAEYIIRAIAAYEGN
jgi:hypothetical protein